VLGEWLFELFGHFSGEFSQFMRWLFSHIQSSRMKVIANVGHATLSSRSPGRLSRPACRIPKITSVAGLRFTAPLHNNSFKPTPLRGAA